LEFQEIRFAINATHLNEKVSSDLINIQKIDFKFTANLQHCLFHDCNYILQTHWRNLL